MQQGCHEITPRDTCLFTQLPVSILQSTHFTLSVCKLLVKKHTHTHRYHFSLYYFKNPQEPSSFPTTIGGDKVEERREVAEEDNWMTKFRPVLSPQFSLPRVHSSIIKRNTFIIRRPPCLHLSHAHLPLFHMLIFFLFVLKQWKRNATTPGWIITALSLGFMRQDVWVFRWDGECVHYVRARPCLPLLKVPTLSPAGGSWLFPYILTAAAAGKLPKGTMRIRHEPYLTPKTNNCTVITVQSSTLGDSGHVWTDSGAGRKTRTDPWIYNYGTFEA